MLEVFLLGALVSLLKLGKLADADSRDFFLGFRRPDHLPDRSACFDRLSRTVDPLGERSPMTEFDPASAAASGLALCHACGRVEPVSARALPALHRAPPPAHAGKPATHLALTFASLLLYFPANLLPILKVESIAGAQAEHDHRRCHPILADGRLSGRDHYLFRERHDSGAENHFAPLALSRRSLRATSARHDADLSRDGIRSALVDGRCFRRRDPGRGRAAWVGHHDPSWSGGAFVCSGSRVDDVRRDEFRSSPDLGCRGARFSPYE